jgi:hypothetical protein
MIELVNWNWLSRNPGRRPELVRSLPSHTYARDHRSKHWHQHSSGPPQSILPLHHLQHLRSLIRSPLLIVRGIRSLDSSTSTVHGSKGRTDPEDEINGFLHFTSASTLALHTQLLASHKPTPEFSYHTINRPSCTPGCTRAYRESPDSKPTSRTRSIRAIQFSW